MTPKQPPVVKLPESFGKIVVVGATGTLGPVLIRALMVAGFDHVVGTTRDVFKAQLSGVRTVQVDLDRPKTLITAFEGTDVVVCALGHSMLSKQPLMIDAAIKAGVKRFVPSEFGCDFSNTKARTLACFAQKLRTEKYLMQKAAEGKITYTSIRCGLFLDYNIRNGLIMTMSDRSVPMYDDGDTVYSIIRPNTVGKSLALALKNPQASNNRTYYIHEGLLTQKLCLDFVTTMTKQKWTPTPYDTESIEDAAFIRYSDGDVGPTVMTGFLIRAVWGKGYGGHLTKVDNTELGVEFLTDSDFIEIVGQALRNSCPPYNGS